MSPLVKWIQEDLKFDFAFNYKEIHLDSILKKYAVEGIDCYFDSVGTISFVYSMGRYSATSSSGCMCSKPRLSMITN